MQRGFQKEETAMKLRELICRMLEAERLDETEAEALLQNILAALRESRKDKTTR